jgi:uncharacterized protein YegL
MTKQNFTSINVIIDASGSMQHLTHDTIGSFNGFLTEQKAFPGEAAFTLCTFNTDYRLVHDFQQITSVSELDATTYCAEGGTALLDAMGTTIDFVGTKLASLDENQRPDKVIFLIITDGHENSSHRYSAAKIKNMVEHQKDKYSWEFVFMGANIDAITTGANLGIDARNTLNYSATSIGTRSLYSAVSASMNNYRSSDSSRAQFFDQPSASPILDEHGNPITVDSVTSTTTVK